ncbi:MAG: lamin tail domain-containing protein [Nanoarchaeota archaeon]|nr:lamin tail domain-containing protein [Nanoarchaeota archaeon]
MKKVIIITLFLALFLVSAVSAQISINEVELNPSGNDTNKEWVELYNSDAPISISGWYIQDFLGDNYSIPPVTITSFYVINSLTDLPNTGNQLKLFDNNSIQIDITPILADLQDDNRTWGRLPDGNGSFVFKEQTKGFSNVAPDPSQNHSLIIENLSYSPSCVTTRDNIVLSSDIAGECIQSVKFMSIINNTTYNLSGNFLTGNTYTTTLSSIFLSKGEVEWKVIATNCFNVINQSNTANFTINPSTSLLINPPLPNGLNSWYLTEPEFTLSNPNATKLFYQWDSSSVINYTSPFGLENTPNNASLNGGILQLHFWSNVCTLEKKQDKLIKIDVSPPIIKNLSPQPESSSETQQPIISAYIDEEKGGNSGVNKSSIYMLFNGVRVNATVKASGLSDAIVSFTPQTNLPLGEYNTTVYAEDNAGRFYQVTWNFNVTILPELNITVSSPKSSLYLTRLVPFNISTPRIVNEIMFIDNSEINPKYRSLCKDCSSYGKYNLKKVTFIEGKHNITIIAKNKTDILKQEDFLIIIDTQQPKIIKTSPTKGFSDSFFDIIFKEENPVSIFLEYGLSNQPSLTQQLNLSECIKDQSSCTIQTDLSQFNDQTIKYSFTIKDIANNSISSRKLLIQVDTMPPVVNSINSSILNKRATFKINLTEKNLDKVTYIDLSTANPKEKLLCSRISGELCKASTTFTVGQHDLTIKAYDKAGNQAAQSITINI